MGYGDVNTAEVMMAGYGGQGVVTIGQLLGESAMGRYNNVSWFPTYETLMRGGRVACYVVLSDEMILSPITSTPEAAIIHDTISMEWYQETVPAGGILIYNSSIIKENNLRDDVRLVPVPANQIALELGNVRGSNLVMLGAYLKASNVLPLEDVVNTLEASMKESGKTRSLKLNLAALRKGYEGGF
jgi:2-oxoglutarate ferredoxin oxidoreductase subunit gamma